MRRAAQADLPAVLEIQRRAFGRVAAHYGIDPLQLPPVRESLGVLTRLMERGTVFLVAVSAQDVVGGVRAHLRCDDSVEIGRLAVEDGWEGRGVGAALMRAAEAAFPRANRFELFTGADMAGPLALYERLGYSVFRSESVAPGVRLVWLEKDVGAP